MSPWTEVSRCDQIQVTLRLKVFPENETIDATHRGVLVAAREMVWDNGNLMAVDVDRELSERNTLRYNP